MTDSATNAATDACVSAEPMRIQGNPWLPALVCAALIVCAAAPPGLAEEPAEDATGEAAPAEAAPAPTEQADPAEADLPRHEDGTINYYQIVVDRYSAGVTPENNGAVLLVRALGPDVYDEEIRKEALAQLGLSVESLAADAPHFQGYRDYYEETVPGATRADANEAREALMQLVDHPWSADDHPTPTAWLKANEKQLALVVEATQRSHFYMPKVSVDDPPTLLTALLPELAHVRKIGWALAARAMLKLDSGDVEGAWADVLAVRRLARQVGRSSTLIELLVGMGMDGMASETGERIITSDSPTPGQLQTMLAESLALPPMQSLAENLVGERLFMLDIVEALKRGPATGDSAGDLDDVLAGVGNGKDVISGLGDENIDWQAVQEAMDYWYSRSINAATAPDYAEHLRLTEELNADFKELTRFMRRALIKPPTLSVQHKLITVLMPDLSRIRAVTEMRDAEGKLFTLALAVELYLARNGQYPTVVEDLTPDYLPEVPIDGFTGEAMRYIRTEDGCKIYSLGPNMIDDGGFDYDDFQRDTEAIMPEGMTEEADDIVIELGRAEE